MPTQSYECENDRDVKMMCTPRYSIFRETDLFIAAIVIIIIFFLLYVLLLDIFLLYKNMDKHQVIEMLLIDTS